MLEPIAGKLARKGRGHRGVELASGEAEAFTEGAADLIEDGIGGEALETAARRVSPGMADAIGGGLPLHGGEALQTGTVAGGPIARVGQEPAQPVALTGCGG